MPSQSPLTQYYGLQANGHTREHRLDTGEVVPIVFNTRRFPMRNTNECYYCRQSTAWYLEGTSIRVCSDRCIRAALIVGIL